MDWIITGASRGIGRALALALGERAGPGDRLFVLARDGAQLAALAELIPRAQLIPRSADLSRIDTATAVGEELAAALTGGATLIHNAGVWPTKLAQVDGYELGFATNCLGPLALQAPLLAAGKLARVLVVSAGLLIKGRFDPEATPSGADFSRLRSYCNTKLAGAVAMREAARLHPAVDFAVIHPGVVNTDLGGDQGLFTWLLRPIKRRWETPERCAERLRDLLARERWEQQPGCAPWFFAAEAQPWPEIVDRSAAAVLTVLRPLPALGLTRRAA